MSVVCVCVFVNEQMYHTLSLLLNPSLPSHKPFSFPHSRGVSSDRSDSAVVRGQTRNWTETFLRLSQVSLNNATVLLNSVVFHQNHFITVRALAKLYLSTSSVAFPQTGLDQTVWVWVWGGPFFFFFQEETWGVVSGGEDLLHLAHYRFQERPRVLL